MFLDDEIHPSSGEAGGFRFLARVEKSFGTFRSIRKGAMEIQNRVSGEASTNGEAYRYMRTYISHIGQRQEIKRGGLKGDVRTSNFGWGTFLGIVAWIYLFPKCRTLLSRGRERRAAETKKYILLPAVTGIQTCCLPVKRRDRGEEREREGERETRHK